MRRLTFRNARGGADPRLAGAICQATGPCILLAPPIARLPDELRRRLGPDRRLIRLRWDGGTSEASESFNPLDVIRFCKNSEDTLSSVLGSLFDPSRPILDEENSRMPPGETWSRMARTLLPAVVRSNLRAIRMPSLVEALNPLFSDDNIYNLAVMLDTKGKSLEPNDYVTIATFLQLSDLHRSALIAALGPSIGWINHHEVQRLTETTSFDLNDFYEGAPVALLEIPHEASETGVMLGRLWLAALLKMVQSRGSGHAPTLLIADGARDPGLLPQLLAAQRLPAGQVDLWTFWENLDQLRHAYPADWAAFVDGCDGVEAAGPQGPIASASFKEFFGTDPAALTTLAACNALTVAGAPYPSEGTEATHSPGDVSSISGHRAIFAGGASGKSEFVAAAIAGRPLSPVIIFETDGNYYRSVGEHRSQPIVRLDPYGFIGGAEDSFNPWDAFALAGTSLDGAFRLAEAAVTASLGSRDPFWRQGSISLIRATLQYLAIDPDKEKGLGGVWDTLTSDDVIYNLAVVLDTTGDKLPSSCRTDLAGFLQLADGTRSRILAEASKDLSLFGKSALRDASRRTTFDVASLLEKPATICIELGKATDPDGVILSRIWMAAITELISRRRSLEHPVLVIVDAAHDPGLLKYLHALQRLPERAVELWSLWETIDQLQAAHSADWAQFLDTANSVIALGPQGFIGASALSNIFDVDRVALQTIKPGQTLALAGSSAIRPSGSALAQSPVSRGGHAAIFAPTATDRWKYAAAMIADGPTVPLIVVESEGEYFRRTASNRKGPIICLDPYQLVGAGTAKFNPLSFPTTASASFEQAANRLIMTLLPTDHATEPYWRSAAVNFLNALVRCLAIRQEPTLHEIRRLTITDEKTAIAELADEAEKIVETQIAAGVLRHFLNKGDAERTSIFSVVAQGLCDFCDPAIEIASSHSSFDPAQVLAQADSAIYIEIPPMNGASGSRLARLWIEAMLPFLRDAKASPLLVVDSPLSDYLLPTLMEHRHDRSFDVLATWDSPDQFTTRLSGGWNAYLASLRHADVIGTLNLHAARRIAAKLGCAVEALEALGDGDVLNLW